MNKSELIEAIAARSELSKAGAGKALDALVGTVTDALKAGEAVTIIGFGTFESNDRPERQGRNPSTGEAMTIKAARIPKFKPGKALKDAIQ